MNTLQIDIDDETLDSLLDTAQAERRPIPWQAAVLLRRALGLPFPHPMNAGEDAATRIETQTFSRQDVRAVRP